VIQPPPCTQGWLNHSLNLIGWFNHSLRDLVGDQTTLLRLWRWFSHPKVLFLGGQTISLINPWKWSGHLLRLFYIFLLSFLSVGKFGVKTYLVVSFRLLVKSMKKFIQHMIMDLNSSGLNPTQIGRSRRCG
jgi:hypothetical protein